MQQDCLQAFSFPWFPTISSPDQGNWPAGTWIPPNDSLTRQYFVLPTLDIATRQCTPSPFVYASIPPNARQQLATWATANIPVPTQCGVDLTQSIVQIISAGPYAADSGSSYAELTLAADNRTASCTYQWVGAPPGVITVNVTISVRDGPIFASDDLLTSGSEESPGWQSQTFYNSTIDVYAALPTTARNFTRVVVCAVQGLDPATLLPLYLTSQPQVILAPGQGWQNFTYPLPDPPTTAPTKRPTRHPSQHPTVHPTVTPSQQPATGSRSI